MEERIPVGKDSSMCPNSWVEEGCVVEGSVLVNSTVRKESVVRNSTVTGSKVVASEVSGAHLTGSGVDHAEVRGTLVEGSRITQSKIRESKVRGSQVRGSDLWCCEVKNSQLLLEGRPELRSCTFSRASCYLLPSLSDVTFRRGRYRLANVRFKPGAVLHGMEMLLEVIPQNPRSASFNAQLQRRVNWAVLKKTFRSLTPEDIGKVLPSLVPPKGYRTYGRGLVHEDAEVEASTISAGAVIGPGVRLRNCFIYAGVHVSSDQGPVDLEKVTVQEHTQVCSWNGRLLTMRESTLGDCIEFEVAGYYTGLDLRAAGCRFHGAGLNPSSLQYLPKVAGVLDRFVPTPRDEISPDSFAHKVLSEGEIERVKRSSRCFTPNT